MKNEHDLEYEKNICYKEGLEEGRQEGREEGRKEGREAGMAEKALSDAKNFLAEQVVTESAVRQVLQKFIQKNQ